MGYNPFQWWKKNKKKRLPQSAHLFDKIQNGDYDYSHYYMEARAAREQAALTFQQVMEETGTYGMARQASRMNNVRAMKLEEEGHKHEFRLFKELREELHKEFGFDLWDDVMEAEPMDLEEMYDYYCHEKMRRRGLDV